MSNDTRWHITLVAITWARLPPHTPDARGLNRGGNGSRVKKELFSERSAPYRCAQSIICTSVAYAGHSVVCSRVSPDTNRDLDHWLSSLAQTPTKIRAKVDLESCLAFRQGAPIYKVCCNAIMKRSKVQSQSFDRTRESCPFHAVHTAESVWRLNGGTSSITTTGAGCL